MKHVVAIVVAALAASGAAAQTVGDLRKREAPVQTGPAAPVEAARVRAAYRHFLDLKAGDPQLRAEALRRLADLELEAADAARGDGSTPSAGVLETRAAIALYDELLAAEPDHPRIDSVLYQLGRAWEAEGEPERALQYLDRLVARFPGSRHIDEAQFRRGEILFSAQRWSEAERAYAAVTGMRPESPFYLQSLYKHGWALFKQSNVEDSARSLLGVLDRKLQSAPGVEIADEASLPRADRELILDTERALGIQFTADDPAGALTGALERHGWPVYAWRLHASLGDLLVGKERYTDAADTYRAFASRRPDHLRSPELQSLAIEAYGKGGFAELAMQGKREYVELYRFSGPFWAARTRADAPEVVKQLKAHLRDVATHQHAVAQANRRPADYQQAARWYRDLLESFPDEPDAAETNYLLADVLFESGAFGDAALEYERTAYVQPPGPRSSAAGYAGLVARERHEAALAGTERAAWHRQSIDAAIRFAMAWPEHPQSGPMWLRSAKQLFALAEYAPAADAAGQVVTRMPPMAREEERAAWSIIADSSFELGRFGESEGAYTEVLTRLDSGAPERGAVTERLGAAIYKQGEARQQAGDTAGAVADFLRVATAAPGSKLVSNAQFDAATLLLRARDWNGAIPILEAFRRDYPQHELARTVPRNLAVAYTESGRHHEAAVEFERVADDAGEDAAFRRTALLQAAEFYDRTGDRAATVRVWARFVERYPRPLDDAMSARQKLADLARDAGDGQGRVRWLREIIAADAGAGADRSDGSRVLAARASLEVAAPLRVAFESVQLTAPLPKSLKAKRDAMEAALTAYRAAADYGVAEVATQATSATAEMYRKLAADLLASERPRSLNEEEQEQYALLLEEQAYPFEEEAIRLHEANAARVLGGIYDDGVRASFAALAELKPARYRKAERLPDAAAHPEIANGLAALAAGRYAEAEGLLAQAAPAAAAWTAIGVARRQLGRMAEAQEAYEGAAMLDPGDPLPVLNRGVLLDLYMGRPEAALVDYERYQALAAGADLQVTAWITEVRRRAGLEEQSAGATP
ncbi:MAG: tetratricopeptide repeat protein [Steroidobacteraceae bacterium]|nr:tetratricopeptide repeat protein [Steroidobacteraceae bacterium]